MSVLVAETYPSGRVVSYEFNQDGDLSRVAGQTANSSKTYANSFNYNSAGSIESFRLGNGKWETAKYNNRQQIIEIGLGNSATDASLLKLEYDYGTNTQNNGSLRSQKISFNGLTQPFEQTYAYDDLNRLLSAEEKVNNSTTWKQTFSYDRFGNRRFDANNTTTLLQSNIITNPTIDTATNRFSSGQNYVYDKNGSLTQDANGMQFVYDAENHQKEVKNSNNQIVGEYLYDGEGKRVKKISSTETVIFVYDGKGQLAAEYSTETAETPQTSYLTTDHLGSPRVITNELGEVTTRKDYMAFGEETFTQQRTSSLNYDNQSETRKGYTGYEKDDESGLDFAQARYYNSAHGRFTSVDPLMASANIRNPQTFNRYSYVLNSPYKYTDPLGLISSQPIKYKKASDLENSTFSSGVYTPTEARAVGDISETGNEGNSQAAPPPAEQNGDDDTTSLVGEQGREDNAIIELPDNVTADLKKETESLTKDAESVQKMGEKLFAKIKMLDEVLTPPNQTNGRGSGLFKVLNDGTLVGPDEITISISKEGAASINIEKLKALGVEFGGKLTGSASVKFDLKDEIKSYNGAVKNFNEKFESQRQKFVEKYTKTETWAVVKKSSLGYTHARLTAPYLKSLYNRKVGKQ